MRWIGLTSENEFYSEHYLSEIFSNDVRGVLETWSGLEADAKEAAKGKGDREPAWRTPWARLASLSREGIQTLEGIKRNQSARIRLEAGRDLTRQLLGCFDLPYAPERISLQERVDSPDLPLLGELKTPQGDPLLWVLEAAALENGDEFDADPLGMAIHADQLKSLQDLPMPKSMGKDDAPTWQKHLATSVFTQAAPPRWVLLVSPFQWLLLDRTKFAQHRLLRFDWVELLARREAETLKAVSVLLHRESLLDAQGQSLLDNLDENAHKHAYGVSEDLKYALRECIEILGNDAAQQLIEQARAKKEGVFTGEKALDPKQLSLECLRYMYRLLFLFYIEARPELGYAPVGSEVYLKGYSLESLRDLELMPLTLESEQKGRFLHDSIQQLFKLVSEGTEEHGSLRLGADQSGRDAFEMRPLRCHLFDLTRTELLNKVTFPNHLLQRVVQLMSLSRPARGRGRRGRISYAQLGINQLGAVYEALLSYRGFFAQEDLYEVKKADSEYDELETGFFVNAQALEAYREDEKVFETNDRGEKRLKRHLKGSFIYRMAGRDREKSASYYTPEVLTRSLVKYALKELVKEQLDPLPDPKTKAEKILSLRICEPAMGSAAFLNEAVSQLADLYLELMQRALNERIPQDRYAIEKQRVKMYLADNCVFGVDLNPVAVELAEVSLWLNALSDDRFVPWFGLQLYFGNSLIGARRQVYDKEQLKRKASDPASWLSTAPANLPMRTPRNTGQIWHFLLPDEGMAAYTDKEVKALYPEQIKAINAWRKEFCKPFSPVDISRLLTLSEKIEELWQEHAGALAKVRERTTDPYSIYGCVATGRFTALSYKDQIEAQELQAEGLTNTSAYRRLKLAMDYWCSLWFWPIDQFEDLPTREDWLFELDNLLLGAVQLNLVAEQPGLFGGIRPVQESLSFVDRFGVVNLEKLRKAFPRFNLVEGLSERRRFFHWEIAFADIFQSNGGFDLTLGNPPWLKVEWNSGAVLGDFEPRYVIRNFSAPELAKLRHETFLSAPTLESTWRDEFEESEGTQNFLNAVCNYPLLKGSQTNLYKCFLPQAWDHGAMGGIAGFLHPEGVYDDPNGGALRRQIYPRLRLHAQYQNEFGLFEGTNDHGRMKFGVHIYSSNQKPSPQFYSISNLLTPATLDLCFSHDGNGPIPGIKEEIEDVNGVVKTTWTTQGHKSRLIQVTEPRLALFATLYDDPGTSALEARLPSIHAVPLLAVLEKFASQPRRLSDLTGDFYSTVMFDETNAPKFGTIRRETRFPSSLNEWILSGPHFFVGNPFNKTPRAQCIANSHYDEIDLLTIPDDYMPRTNYVPACTPDEYKGRIPKVPWANEVQVESCRVTDYFRLVLRAMLSQSGERTLAAAIIPKGVAHINGARTYVYKNMSTLIDHAAMVSSLTFDFICKTTAKANLHQTLDDFSFVDLEPVRAQVHVRMLSLSSVTSAYESLWVNTFRPTFQTDSWSIPSDSDHPGSKVLPRDFFSKLTSVWERGCALRSDYARRQALLEIDVLVAQSTGLTLDELVTIYRVQFPVMRQHEADTWYDQNGRQVFSCRKGKVGLPRNTQRSDLSSGTSYSVDATGWNESSIALGWNDIKRLQEGTVSKTFQDDTLPGGPREKTITYQAPFFKPDREEDYRIAWAFFEKEGKS